MRPVRRHTPEAGNVPHVEVRAALQRIVGGEAFAGAPQLQRFLIYVVEEALAGRAARLKQYTLGLEVFDRGPGFDPRIDPIVRVDARRLRARLESHYADGGAGDSVEIALPRGSYTPLFRRRAAANDVAAADRAGPPRLAVLPFQSLGEGAEDEAFAAGLVDELTLALGRRPEVQVIGRASTARFRAGSRDLGDIGRRLDAALILEGTVRRDGTALRITVALTSAADGRGLWAERYDTALDGTEQIFALQDRIATNIAERLTPKATEIAGPSGPPTRDIVAYELYLRGRHQLRRLNPAVLPQAMRSLAAALERDPAYAHAKAALADAHFARAIYLMDSPAPALEEARALARAALALDPAVAAAHVRLAVLSAVLDHDFAAAADGFARAQSLEPRAAAEARRNRACWLLAPLGRLDDAADELARLLEGDPYSLRLRLDYARVLIFQRRYGDAIRQLGMMLDMEPRFAAATYYLAFAYEHSGDLALARATHQRQVQQFPYGNATRWLDAVSAIWDGVPDRAAKIVGAMEAEAADGPAAAVTIADIHRRLGQPDRAIDWLERAIEARVYHVVYLKVDPAYDSLKAEPRFRALLRRVRLARPHRSQGSI